MTIEAMVFMFMAIAMISAFGMLVAPHITGPALMFGTLFALIAMVSGVQIVIETIIIIVFIFVVAFLWDTVNSFNLDIS